MAAVSDVSGQNGPKQAVNAAIFYHPEGFVAPQRGKLMGRHAAGEGFLSGFARHGSSRILYAFAESREHFDRFCKQVRVDAGDKKAVWLPHTQPEKLAEPGAVFLPGPGLGAHAWQRRCHDPCTYSLTGITHTICSARVMDSLGELLTAPLEEWDAVICTSPAVKAAAQSVMSDYGKYLAERFGAPEVKPKLQLPVIPLGVDCERLGSRKDTAVMRKKLRNRHRIGAGDIAVLFFGRLSFHAKAHPLPMYLALEAASKAAGRRVHLIQAGWFANDALEKAFVEGARALCPSVRNIFVDGRSREVRDSIWPAADIFCSLSDNIQETFGLTPVEAMAAGLPVVVSDWDGYRGTVEQGETGFLVPTMMPPPGSGADLANRHFSGADTYDLYIGHVSQSAAVDIRETTRAFTELIQNPELRREMGARGCERARRLFDWRVIIEQYEALWRELGERRRAAAQASSDRGLAPGVPLRADPFQTYAHYPSRLMDPEMRITVDTPAPYERFRTLLGLHMNNFARGIFASDEEIRRMLERVQVAGSVRLADLLADAAPARRFVLYRTIAWLAKLGIVKEAR